jgi:hypothetical protein
MKKYVKKFLLIASKCNYKGIREENGFYVLTATLISALHAPPPHLTSSPLAATACLPLPHTHPMTTYSFVSGPNHEMIHWAGLMGSCCAEAAFSVVKGKLWRNGPNTESSEKRRPNREPVRPPWRDHCPWAIERKKSVIAKKRNSWLLKQSSRR